MAKPTKVVARPKRSKAETEQEFSLIQEEVTAARETSEAKSEEVRKAREAETRAAVEGLSVETVVGEISNLGLEVSSPWPHFPMSWCRKSTAWRRFEKP